jgi:hypothetical protein
MSNLSEKPEYAPRPAWVKWLVIGAAALLVVVVIALLSGGEHGPGRHMSHAREAGVSDSGAGRATATVTG